MSSEVPDRALKALWRIQEKARQKMQANNQRCPKAGVHKAHKWVLHGVTVKCNGKR